ncbi:MAG TPA: Arm DNA-binding domain-containing protein [Puia sp.]|nr:Arm DNA-binding domain-containing protein [Puia sp.]
MEHRINVLFYARKSKKNRDGLVPLYIRITVNGRRLDTASNGMSNSPNGQLRRGG